MLNTPIALILFGVLVGVFSGVMGLGGGSIMIPIMVLALGMTQTQAHGTSLAVMIPPVALPAVIGYYLTVDPDTGRRNVDVRVAAWIAVGVLLGSYFGSKIATHLPKETLKLVFGFVLIYVAGYTVFGKENVVRSAVLAAAIVLVAVLVFAGMKWFDGRQRDGAARQDGATVRSEQPGPAAPGKGG